MCGKRDRRTWMPHGVRRPGYRGGRPAACSNNQPPVDMMPPSLKIVEADLHDVAHQGGVVDVVDAYCRDPMGDGIPLRAEVRKALIPGLQQHPTTIVFLAFADEDPVGIAVCFRGFSTFAAKPLINIHDFAVLPTHRKLGIGRLLLAAIEQRAVELGCCKLTLETQENNTRARHIYEAAGFTQAVYRPEAGGSLAYAKPLSQRPPSERVDPPLCRAEKGKGARGLRS